MLGLNISRSTRFPQIKFGDSEIPIDAPDWFTWAYSFGRNLVLHEQELRSGLVVVTSPCQSSLIGAIALGSLVKLLESQVGTIENDRHFETLYAMPPGTLVKKKDKSRKRPRVFKLLRDRCREKGIKMKQVKGPKKFADSYIYLTRVIALSYVVESEDTTNPDQAHSLAPYPGAAIIEKLTTAIPENQTWRNNLDEIVISGPTGGNSSPKKQLVSTHLMNEESEGLPLHELLAVREWKDESRQSPHYSRFFNSSKAKAEMSTIVKNSRFVFFNSVDSFLRFGDRFDRQIKVLVSSRDVDSNKTDRLFVKLYAYRQRATPVDPKVTQTIASPPFGLQLMYYGAKTVKEKQW